MHDRIRPLATVAVLAAAVLAFPARSLAELCDDLIAARLGAATARANEVLREAVERARARVADAKAKLDAAEAAARVAEAQRQHAILVFEEVRDPVAFEEGLRDERERVRDDLTKVEEKIALAEGVKKRYEEALVLRDRIWRDPQVVRVRARIRSLEQLLQEHLGAGHTFGRVEQLHQANLDPTGVADLTQLREELGEEAGRAGPDIAELQKLRTQDLRETLMQVGGPLGLADAKTLQQLRLDFDASVRQLEGLESERRSIRQRSVAATSYSSRPQRLSEAAKDRQTAIERHLEAERGRRYAQTSYDEAVAELQQAEAQLAQSASGDAARDAESRVTSLEQQLEGRFQGLLRDATSEALNALLQSSTPDECVQEASKADASLQRLIAFAQANAACLAQGHRTEIDRVYAQVRRVRDRCTAPPVDTRRGDAGGFESSGTTTDVSATPAGSISAPQSNAEARNIDEAINACNFDLALARLNIYEPADPNDAWMAAKYRQVHEQRERVAAVKRLIDEVRSTPPDASEQDLRRASALLRTAGSIAPNCMSGAIAGAGTALAAAADAAKTANRERSREAARRWADALKGLEDAINNQRTRGGPDISNGTSGGGGVDTSPPTSQGSPGGFESAGGSGGSTGSTGSGQAGGGGTSGVTPPPVSSTPPPQNSASCQWVKEPGLLGNVSDLVECRCNGQKAPDNRCTGPRPR